MLDRGIRHLYIKLATPLLNGKVERSHRIDDEDFYRLAEGVVVDDTALFTAKLQEWEHFYNFERPHAASENRNPTVSGHCQLNSAEREGFGPSQPINTR